MEWILRGIADVYGRSPLICLTVFGTAQDRGDAKRYHLISILPLLYQDSKSITLSGEFKDEIKES